MRRVVPRGALTGEIVTRKTPQRSAISPKLREGIIRGLEPLKKPNKKAPRPLADPVLDFQSDDQLLTIEQVKSYLSASEWLTRRLVRSGRLPSVYIGDMVRVRLADLRAFIAAHRTIGLPDPVKKKRRRKRKPKS